MDGVVLLVRSGFALEYVLEEMTMDVFKQAILLVTRQQIQLQQHLGLTIIRSLAAILTKEGGKKALDDVEKILADIDERLHTSEEPAEFGERGVVLQTASKSRRRSPAKLMESLGQFHKNFAKFTGAKMPTLDSAIKAASRQQVARQKLLSKTEQ